MADAVLIRSVSGEVPPIEDYQQLLEILHSFGVSDAIFGDLPEPAQVFLVGQYGAVRKYAREAEKLKKKLLRAQKDLDRIRHQRGELCKFLRDNGVPDKALQAFTTTPALPALHEDLLDADQQDATTCNPILPPE